MSGAFRFDPDRVAALETAAWRAYYDREWPLLLYWTERGCAEQFHIPFPLSLRAAYYAMRGAMAFSARGSAEWRTSAAITVDRITGRRSTDVGGDWRRLEAELRRCYRSLQRELEAAS